MAILSLSHFSNRVQLDPRVKSVVTTGNSKRSDDGTICDYYCLRPSYIREVYLFCMKTENVWPFP